MILTNTHHLPEALVAAVQNDPYDNGGADRSLTELIGPAKAAALKRAHEATLTHDVLDMLYLLDGQLMHALLERAGKSVGAKVETRLHAMILGWDISGQYDALRLDGTTLVDYKRVSIWSMKGGHKIEHENQLNSLAYLLRVNGHTPPTKLQIMAWARDWMKRQAGKKGHPELPAYLWDVPLWPEARQKAYLEARVYAHQVAQQALDFNDPLPRCTDDETWQGKRCADYCDAAPHCLQAKETA